MANLKTTIDDDLNHGVEQVIDEYTPNGSNSIL